MSDWRENGPWRVAHWERGRVALQSDDFTFDVALEISGDFMSAEEEVEYAQRLADALNSIMPLSPPPPSGEGGK